MTKRQLEVLKMYLDGNTQEQIAEQLNVNRSTVSRTLRRAMSTKCPFGSTCDKCILPECAIDERYSYLLNPKRCDLRKRNIMYSDLCANLEKE